MSKILEPLFGQLAENGYQKLPSGLIIQWGLATPTNGTVINFPIQFPNAVRHHSWGGPNHPQYNESGSLISTFGLSGFTTSSFTTSSFTARSTGTPAVTYWMAIGY